MMQPSNPVPPGATEKEVADDVDVKVSEGEFVIPANVVRFYGSNHFLKLIQKAEEAIASEERLGGEPGKLPFPEEELEAEEEVQKFAAGGLVQAGSISPQQTRFGGKMYLPSEQGEVASAQMEDPLATPIKKRPSPAQNFFSSNPSGDQGSYGRESKPTGTAGAVDKWTVDDFNSYNKQISTQSGKVGTAVMGKLAENLPLVGAFTKLRENYLSKAVPETIGKMLETGLDNQGNPLTDEQKDSLKNTLDNHSNYKKPSSNPLDALSDLMKTKEQEKKEEKSEDSSSDSTSTESTDSLSDQENQTPKTETTTTETTSEDTLTMARGGLIVRKRK